MVPLLEQELDFETSWPWRQSLFLLAFHWEDWVLELVLVWLAALRQPVPVLGWPSTMPLIYQVVALGWRIVLPQLVVVEEDVVVLVFGEFEW